MYYTVEEKEVLIDVFNEAEKTTRAKRGRQEKRVYYELPASFDIETSSFYEGEEKRAIMYHWQLGIDGYCFCGRTWDEFIELYNFIASYTQETTLIIYCHNLSFEYGWIKNRLSFIDVFKKSNVSPMYAITKENIEFRCSYLLSGKSLESLAKSLQHHNIKKLDSLDYSKIRHSNTELTYDEIQYCLNDILIVMYYIEELIERYGSISKLPLTKTGFTRKKIRNNIFNSDKRVPYMRLMKGLTMTEDLYRACKRASNGGAVCINSKYKNKEVEDVASFDITSSYIYQLICSERFPMYSARKETPKNIDEFYNLVNNFACIFNVSLCNLKLKKDRFIAPILESKIFYEYSKNVKVNADGKVYEAEEVALTITDVDYEIIDNFYDFDIKVDEMYVFNRGYLPNPLRISILELYKAKQSLKGIKGKEEDYELAKSDLDGVFGCMVMDIDKQAESIEDYNTSRSRFTYYPWGIFTMALARMAYFQCVSYTGDDFIYGDTDSAKIKNLDNNIEFFNIYNEIAENNFKDVLSSLGLPADEYIDINGRANLGCWDFEGVVDKFKVVRNKAYLTQKNGEYKLILSGTPSKNVLDYIKKKGDPFEEFKDKLYVPSDATNKQLRSFIDFKTSGTVKDYNGEEFNYEELSSIHIEPVSYTLYENEEEEDFLNFINYYKNRI